MFDDFVDEENRVWLWIYNVDGKCVIREDI